MFRKCENKYGTYCRIRFLRQDSILSVRGQWLGICIVGRSLLYLGNEILIEEQLANMADDSALECGVRKHGAVVVRQDVDVGGAAGVMTREQSRYLDNTFRVGGLDAS